MRLFQWRLTIFLLMTASAQALTNDEVLKTLSHPEIEAQLPSADPSLYYLYAGRLLKEGDMPAALVWGYIAQLRFRVYLHAHPGTDNSLYSALNVEIGGPVNRYAAKHVDQWLKAIDAALAWDDQHDNGATPKTQFGEAYAKERAGLLKLKETIVQHPERFQAAASGEEPMPKGWAPLVPIHSTKELEGLFVRSTPMAIVNVLISSPGRPPLATEFEIQAVADDRILAIARTANGETGRGERQVKMVDGAARFDLPDTVGQNPRGGGSKGVAYLRRNSAGDLVLERDMVLERERFGASPVDLEKIRWWARASLKPNSPADASSEMGK